MPNFSQKPNELQNTYKSQESNEEILRRIDSSVQEIRKSIGDEKVFSTNTLSHVVLPAVLGGIVASLVSLYGFGFPERYIIRNENKNPGFYTSLVFVSGLLSTVLTAGVVGLPNSTDKRRRSWMVAVSFALMPGLTAVSLINQSDLGDDNDQLSNTVQEQLQEKLEIQDKATKSEDDLKKIINSSISITITLLNTSDNVNAIEGSIESVIELVNKNQNALDSNIKNKLNNLYNKAKNAPYLRDSSVLKELENIVTKK